MKKAVLLLFTVAWLLLLTACHMAIPVTVPDEVVEAAVAPYGSELMTFRYTDAEKISVFVDYIRQLRVVGPSPKDDPHEMQGMGYCVTFVSSDGKETVYEMYGNDFFRQKDEEWGKWYRLASYEQATAFVDLLREYEPDIPAEKPLFSE